MISAKIAEAGIKKLERNLKRVHRTGKGGVINIVKFGAKAGVGAMVTMTGKPIKKTTRYVWADKAKTRVIDLGKDGKIPTPGAGFGRAGWARVAQKLNMKKAAEYGYGPGSALVRLNTTEPIVRGTNSVYYVANMDAGRALPGIPHSKMSYRGPHVHRKSKGIVKAGMKKAEANFKKNIDKTIERMKSNWR
jgi:hypothetical protein